MNHQPNLLVRVIAASFCLMSTVAPAQQGRIDPVVAAIDADSSGTISAASTKGSGALFANSMPTATDSCHVMKRPVVLRTKQGKGGGGGSRLGGYTTPPPANNVPTHPFNLIVGRLTDHSATVRVLCHDDAKVFLAYGEKQGSMTSRTQMQELLAGVPFDFVIDSLQKDTRYYYRLFCRTGGKIQQSDEYSFHTQREDDSAFVFTVQADSHLDENTSGDVYLRTLANASADQPDFHFALGDTFMTGKYEEPELSLPQYLAQRYYLGHLCHSAALYFALGNHDGELGNRGSNVWATTTRKRYIPNPFPNDFYTGNEQREPEVGLPENYYQFQWGDCQFIVLDPFRHTTTRSRGGSSDNWHWTLGDASISLAKAFTRAERRETAVRVPASSGRW